ncbi:MAG: hypothetical protein MUO89_04925 [Dehalococcoidia bacterium]|nr:hypothetical protein [Dehalococcoidia bacterium]
MVGEQKTVLELKASPEIEKAVAEQMRILPQKSVQLASKEAAANCFGLVVCCIGAAAAVEPGLLSKPIK